MYEGRLRVIGVEGWGGEPGWRQLGTGRVGVRRIIGIVGSGM